MTTDPVCGMKVDENNAPAQSELGGKKYSFCSQQCKDKFDRSPATICGKCCLEKSPLSDAQECLEKSPLSDAQEWGFLFFPFPLVLRLRPDHARFARGADECVRPYTSF